MDSQFQSCSNEKVDKHLKEKEYKEEERLLMGWLSDWLLNYFELKINHQIN